MPKLQGVIKFGMGVDGVAYATIISQGVSALLVVITLFDGSVDLFLKLSAVGQGQFYGGHGFHRTIHLDGRLGVEEDDQFGAVGIAGVKVPPFVGAAAAVGAHAVFPDFYLISGQTQLVVVKIVIGMDGCLNLSHGMILLVYLVLL